MESDNCSYRPFADESPGEEFARLVSKKIEVHVLAGHWPLAAMVLRQAYEEWVAERRARDVRSSAEWLERPLMELRLLTRTENALQKAGCSTIGDALKWLYDGGTQRNFGPAMAEEVWLAAERLGISAGK